MINSYKSLQTRAQLRVDAPGAPRRRETPPGLREHHVPNTSPMTDTPRARGTLYKLRSCQVEDTGCSAPGFRRLLRCTHSLCLTLGDTHRLTVRRARLARFCSDAHSWRAWLAENITPFFVLSLRIFPPLRRIPNHPSFPPTCA